MNKFFQSTALRRNIRQRWVGLAIVSGAIGWMIAALVGRPDAIFSETFLWRDGGQNLVVCEQILAGRVFFRDIFTQYGPLPTYFYAGIAALFGNSVTTYISMVGCVTAINVWLMYKLLRGNTAATTSIIICFVAVFPVFLLPGSFTAGYPETIYYGFERALILIAVMLWRPAIANSRISALMLGLCLGMLQTVKFGGAFVLGLSVFAVDLCFLIRAGLTRASLIQWGQATVMVLLGFLAVEIVLVIAAFSYLPRDMAQDFLWPTYMLKGYASYVTNTTRGFEWMGTRFFVARQLGPLCALAMAVGTAVLFSLKSATHYTAEQREFIGRMLILACFYVVGLIAYFKQIWLIYAYVWTLLLSAAWMLNRANWFGRVAFVCACLPCFWINVKSLSPSQRPADVSFHAISPDIGLWLSTKGFLRVESLQKVLRQLGRDSGDSQRGVIIVPAGGGLHVAYGIPPLTRHTWFMVGAIRPYDEPEVVAAVDRSFAVICISDEPPHTAPSTNPATWPLYLNGSPFSARLGEAIASKLETPLRIDDGCWVFPVKKSVPSASRPVLRGYLDFLVFVSQPPFQPS